MRQRPAAQLTFVLAAALALAIGWDGARALTEQQRCYAEAEFCGTVADGLKKLKDEDEGDS
jgi:hypothetical protein